MTPDDLWPTVQEWIAAAPFPVTALEPDLKAGEATAGALGLTPRSVLGSIVLNTGGLLVDHGWLRLLGSGHPRIGSGLREWNAEAGGEPLDPPLDGALVVGYDAIGGVFAINGGRWDGEPGSLYYYAPDTFEWEALGLHHGAFVEWALSDRLPVFYEGRRWRGWEAEVEALGPDQVISVWPPVGINAVGAPRALEDRSRKAVSARSQWSFDNEIGEQIGGLLPGTPISFEVS
jgi:Protein of unknown function DUF2625